MIEYTDLPYDKAMIREVKLPSGVGNKGNLCFLFSKDFDSSIEMMTNQKNCKSMGKYRLYFRNLKYIGKLTNNKIYRINELNSVQQIKDKLKTDCPMIKFYPQKTGIDPNENRNIFVDLYRWVDIYQTGVKTSTSVSRNVKMFWSLMTNVIGSYDAKYAMNNKKALQTNVRPGSYTNYFVLMDTSKFPFINKGKPIDKIKNPLYLIYLTAHMYPEYLMNMDIDFVCYYDKMTLRINPYHLVSGDKQKRSSNLSKLLMEIRKLYRYSERDKETGELTETEIAEIKKDEGEEVKSEENKKSSDIQTSSISFSPDQLVSQTDVKEVPNISKKAEKIISSSTTSSSVKKVVSAVADDDKIVSKVEEKKKEAEKSVSENKDIPEENKEEEIQKKTEELLDDDKEILDEIYKKMQQKSPVRSQRSTARDEMLREKQKDIIVRNTTIGELAKINPKEKEIDSNKVGDSMQTTNPNMKEIKFQNFNESYCDKVMDKDIIGVFENLNQASSIKMYIRDVKVEDTSDVLNYKETWTVHLEDENRQRHTIKVDIPKFYDKNFLWLSGNKKVIKNQLFFLPVVKISGDTVMIVTNYNKLTIKREENKTLREVSLIIKQLAKNPSLGKYFVPGSCFMMNKNFITAVEYDEFSKVFIRFKTKDCSIFFDQNDAVSYMEEKRIKPQEGKMFIGVEKGNPIFIDYNIQRDDIGRGIGDIILDNIPKEDSDEIKKMNIPKRLMYTKITTMKQDLPMIVLMCIWEGLSTVLKKAGIKYRLEENIKNIKTTEDFIRFKNCYLVYDSDVNTEILMNGFKMIDTKDHDISEYEEVTPFIPFIQKKFGKVSILNALTNVYEFTIGAIEREILLNMGLPTDLVQLMVYANSLLGDNQALSELTASEYRVRDAEVIPAILYDCIAKAFVPFKNSNGKKKLSIPQDAVIKKLLALQTVEDMSTLNPFLELETTHGISTKGWRGVNLEDSYTVPKRSYDKTMTGIIGVSSSPDGNVGVNRTLTMEPSVESCRGYIKTKDDKLDELHDVNLFSPAEMLIPLGVSRDDPIRTGHSVKQSRATIPVKDASPVLISNGSDELCKYYLSSDFVVNAEDDGEVVEYDETTKLMIVKYKNGKCRAINLDKNIVKNGGGGFELSNVLITNLKVGDRFKKNDTLAWHKDFFKYIPTQGVRMNVGARIKVALYSTYNTYEDANFITRKVSDMCATEMCFRIKTSIGKNSNIYNMVKVGDRVNVGDPLIEFDESFEDSDINKLLASLGDNSELVETVSKNSRNTKKSKYSGVIEEIKIYSASELEDLSPSLQKIVGDYYKKIDRKNRILNKYDKEGKTVKCGLMMTESSGKTEPDRYGNIRGIKVNDGVAIEFYVKHSEPLEVGSKVANFSPLKNVVSEVIPYGYEPYSEYRPNESVDTIINPSSILNRMVASIIPTMFGNKVIIELKESLREIWNGKEEFSKKRGAMESLVYRFFKKLDPTGDNTKKYQSLFRPMSDQKFKNFCTEFFNNPDHFLILDTVDYDRDLQVEYIEEAAKVINCPLYEYVSFPHLNMDKDNPIITKHKVPVGYIHLKRPQQTVMKKNGLSIQADQRSAYTGQVTGGDKNGRESDLENCMLTSLGMKYTLKELNGPRADDLVMKKEMLEQINRNGYTELNTLTDKLENKTTLNTINTYFLGMGLHTDLVTKGLKLPYNIDKE